MLIAPHLVKNLISIRALTCDNSISVKFYPWGFSIKDLHTKMVLLRCDSSGELYPLRQLTTTPSSPPAALLASSTSGLWHAHLGHPGHDTLQRLSRSIILVLPVPSLANIPVMPVAAANMYGYPFVSPIMFLNFPFKFCIVMYGPHQ